MGKKNFTLSDLLVIKTAVWVTKHAQVNFPYDHLFSEFWPEFIKKS